MFGRFFATFVRGTQWLGLRRPALHPISRNHVSTLQSPSRLAETVSLPVGGNGFVDLEILHPLKSSPDTDTNTSTSTSKSKSKSKSKSNTILVHLPPGPKAPGTTQHKSIINSIHDLAPHFQDATLIDIRYRLGPRDSDRDRNILQEQDHRFPTPIHDVFTAWEYVVDPDSPHNQTHDHNHQRDYPDEPLDLEPEPRICLYGSHIGGALALSLALTNPNQIHAVAIEEPLVDWVILDELLTFEGAISRTTATGSSATRRSSRMRSARSKQEEYEAVEAAAKALITLRTSLFRSPSGYFDSFASPVLFLRAPGRDTPLTQSAAPEESVFGLEDGKRGDERVVTGYSGQAFGPYDDDWHTAAIPKQEDEQSISGRSASSYETAVDSFGSDTAEQPVTDLSYWRPDDLDSEQSNSPKRRKVLRRWPSITLSEEALLPYVNILVHDSQPSKSFAQDGSHCVDISPVIHAQAVELHDLLRRACFWGREKGLAEDRVDMTESKDVDSDCRNELVQWLRTRIEDGRG